MFIFYCIFIRSSVQFSSVTQSCPTLQPHESQHARPPCPSPTPGVHPNSWTDWISLQSKGVSRVFSNTTVQKHQFFNAQLSSQSNSHIHTWLPGKTIALTRRTFVGKGMSLLFNMLFRLVITFLPCYSLELCIQMSISFLFSFAFHFSSFHSYL